MNKDLGYRDLFAYAMYITSALKCGKQPKKWKEMLEVEQLPWLEAVDEAMENFVRTQSDNPKRN